MIKPSHFLDTTEENFRNTIDVNALGTLITQQEAAKQMIAQGHGGKLVLVSSIAGRQGYPDFSAYCASKAGLVGLSGYLPLAASTAAERSPANAALPIFMAHGAQDPIVVPARGTASRDALRALGHDVAWHDYPMPHSVCPEEISDLNAWLLTQLA